MTRIYVDAATDLLAERLTGGLPWALPEDAARHVAQVLRMRAGETLTVFNGDGHDYAAELVAVERRQVQLRLTGVVAVAKESPLQLCLLQCVSKGERMDYTIQKAVELGVQRIVPVLSARSVVKLDAERWDKKLEHWRGVLVAACEQSGRARLPVLEPVSKLDAALAQPAAGLHLVLAPGGAARLRELPAAPQVSLLVGPEGGLAEAEIVRAERAGYQRLGLGPRVLRTETAGVAALAALQMAWGDF